MADEHESKAAVEVTRIYERNRTTRWLIAGVVIAFCVWQVSCAVVAVVNRPDPPWLKLTLAIIAFLSALLIGNSPVIWVLKAARAKIAAFAVRKEKLELIVDPQRSSSQLAIDGTHPND